MDFQEFFKHYMNFCLVLLSGAATETSLSNWQIRGYWSDIVMSVFSIFCLAYYWKKSYLFGDAPTHYWKEFKQLILEDKRLKEWRIAIAILCVIGAGCLELPSPVNDSLNATPNGATSNIADVGGTGTPNLNYTGPAIKIEVDNDSHLFTVVGEESGMEWANVTTEFIGDSDVSCHNDLPTHGHIHTKDVIHITANTGICDMRIDYTGLTVGDYTFSFTNQD